MDSEQDGGIGQQRKRQPLQEKDVAVVWYKYLEQQCSNDKERRHQMTIDTADKFCDLPHGCNVRGNIQRIGNQQQQDDALEHNRRERRLDICGKSLAGDPPNLRAHGLDRGH